MILTHWHIHILEMLSHLKTVLEMLEWTRSGPVWTTSGPTSIFFFEIWPQVNVPKIQDLFIFKDSVEIFFKF